MLCLVRNRFIVVVVVTVKPVGEYQYCVLEIAQINVNFKPDDEQSTPSVTKVRCKSVNCSQISLIMYTSL